MLGDSCVTMEMKWFGANSLRTTSETQTGGKQRKEIHINDAVCPATE